jgi:hypothetical protein
MLLRATLLLLFAADRMTLPKAKDDNRCTKNGADNSSINGGTPRDNM